MRIVLCVTGSIAAYKAVEVARSLRDHEVIPVLTRAGAELIGAQTLAGITGSAVHESMWDPGYPGEKHVDLAKRADVIAIVPATADVLSRLAHGRADDLVTALCLCARCPIVAAPAMHPNMWEHPATQRNLALLDRVTLVGPVSGPVASGDAGMGRLAEPAEIARAIVGAAGERDLEGAHVVVTAGPTVEDLDPVRFLSNRSSGKMGFSIAERARARGARVALIAGPVSLATPREVRRVEVRSAREMKDAVFAEMGAADVIIMTAAVADFRPREIARDKIKKGASEEMTIELVKNDDILKALGEARTGARPVLVGFAVESQDLESYARKKLTEKKVDLVVANDASVAFGGDESQVLFVTRDDATKLGPASKREIADALLHRVKKLLRD